MITEEQRMLQEAANEIRSLRIQNEKMSARLDVFDTMMRLFHSTPNWGNSGGMSPDLVYEIEKYLKNSQ